MPMNWQDFGTIVANMTNYVGYSTLGCVLAVMGLTFPRLSEIFDFLKIFIAFPYLFAQCGTFMLFTAWSGILLSKPTPLKKYLQRKMLARVAFKTYFLANCVMLGSTTDKVSHSKEMTLLAKWSLSCVSLFIIIVVYIFILHMGSNLKLSHVSGVLSFTMGLMLTFSVTLGDMVKSGYFGMGVGIGWGAFLIFLWEKHESKGGGGGGGGDNGDVKTIGHVDHGKTTLTAAITNELRAHCVPVCMLMDR